MNATATVDSTALNVKKVRSERGVTSASEFMAACLASLLGAGSGPQKKCAVLAYQKHQDE